MCCVLFLFHITKPKITTGSRAKLFDDVVTADDYDYYVCREAEATAAAVKLFQLRTFQPGLAVSVCLLVT